MRHIILLIALLTVACSGIPTLKPYKMDIQQGNIVTSKMMLQLKPGMTKSQVRFIMGTPLLQDSFHKDRWDYFYQMRKDGKVIEQRRVILEFDNEALAKVRGDVIAASTDELHTTPAEAKKPETKKGLIDSLKFWNSDDKSKAAPAPQEAPAELVNPGSVPAVKQVEPAPKPAAVVPAPAPVEPAAKPVAPSETKSEPVSKPVDAAPAKAAEPAPVAKPVEPVKPAEKAAEKVTKPATKAESKPAVTSKKAPEPEKELPPEEEPGYFERMLEKIGF